VRARCVRRSKIELARETDTRFGRQTTLEENCTLHCAESPSPVQRFPEWAEVIPADGRGPQRRPRHRRRPVWLQPYGQVFRGRNVYQYPVRLRCRTSGLARIFHHKTQESSRCSRVIILCRNISRWRQILRRNDYSGCPRTFASSSLVSLSEGATVAMLRCSCGSGIWLDAQLLDPQPHLGHPTPLELRFLRLAGYESCSARQPRLWCCLATTHASAPGTTNWRRRRLPKIVRDIRHRGTALLGPFPNSVTRRPSHLPVALLPDAPGTLPVRPDGRPRCAEGCAGGREVHR